jgi:hypothetical protein
MNQKFVIISLLNGVPECYGSFKKFCKAKGLIYQTYANKRKVPKLGEPVEIENYIVFKVEAI